MVLRSLRIAAVAGALLASFALIGGCGHSENNVQPTTSAQTSKLSPEEQIKAIENDNNLPAQVKQAQIARIRNQQPGASTPAQAQ